MSPLTRRILKTVVFIGVFFMIGILGTIIGVVGEKTSGGNNFRTPGWAMIAAIVIPGYLCLSPWANKKIWKKESNMETSSLPELIDERPKSMVKVIKNHTVVQEKPAEQSFRTTKSEPNFCGNCGTSLFDAKNFCANCGNKL